MAYTVEDMLAVALLLRQPSLQKSLRRMYFHLLRPVGRFPPIRGFNSRGCVECSRTILLDLSRPGGRGYRSRCRIEKSGLLQLRFGKCCAPSRGGVQERLTRATSLPLAPYFAFSACDWL